MSSHNPVNVKPASKSCDERLPIICLRCFPLELNAQLLILGLKKQNAISLYIKQMLTSNLGTLVVMLTHKDTLSVLLLKSAPLK